MGIVKVDTIEDVEKKVEQGVEIASDHQVIITPKLPPPNWLTTSPPYTDLGMREALGAGGKELYGQKVVGTDPFSLRISPSTGYSLKPP